MRRIAVVSLAVLALAACNQASTTTSASGQSSSAAPAAGNPMAAVFPNLFQGSYRLEANQISSAGAATPVVMIRDGRKMRMEMNRAGVGPATVISDPDKNVTMMIMTRNGQQTAVSMPSNNVQDMASEWAGDVAQASHPVGACSAAGEVGVEWAHDAVGDIKAGTICLTTDGIPLKGTSDGRPTWEATRLQRGPQDPGLFAAPAGVRVMNVNPAAAAAVQAAMERMHAKQH